MSNKITCPRCGKEHGLTDKEKILINGRMMKLEWETREYVEGWISGYLIARFGLNYLEIMDLIDQAEMAWNRRESKKRDDK